MLQLKQITKDYPAGSGVVHALRGVDLNFRSSEFVSILGPSGCGKTTLLNIMGGLDQYTSGDLVIGGRSTRHFKDRDWDTYRNHSVGFVFQSYNLIPHQSVLQNVELALSLSGVPKAERRRRAAQALQQVGLGGELRKKPGQMSGGQMQRVAIARALVNDPEIILADEPTGALDTETSVQVMDILKEISKERLVIMVTHNPELAAKYSTRIIRMLDGRITDDSAPLTDAELAAEQQQETQQQGRQKKPSLSFATSFALSLKNLVSKRGRTLLTAFAGSIGIIGIALIYAVSQGMTDYIDAVQEDTLSTYPLVITSETADMTAMLTAFGSVLADDENQPPNTVREQQLMKQVFAQIGTNDLTAFKQHLEASMDTVGEDINALRYSYNVTPQIYSRDFSHGVVQVNPGQLFSSAMMGGGMSMMNTEVFQEMLDNPQLLQEQFDVLAGRWPSQYNEMLLVLSEPDAMPDFLVYSLNLRDGKELKDMLQKVMEGESVQPANDPKQWTYNDLLGLSFSLVHASDRYRYNAEYGVWEDMSGDEAYMKQLVNSGETLSIVGIVTPKEGVSAAAMSMGVAHLPSLREHVMQRAADTAIVRHQLADETVDVFTGKPFSELEEEEGSSLDFNDMITVDEQMLSEAFGIELSEDYMAKLMQGYMTDISSAITTDTAPAYNALKDTLSALCGDMLRGYITQHADTETGVAVLPAADAASVAAAYMAADGAQKLAALEQTWVVPQSAFSQIYTPMVTMFASSVADMPLTEAAVEGAVSGYVSGALVNPMAAGIFSQTAAGMTEAVMQKTILTKVGEMSEKLVMSIAGSFNVDPEKIAGAFSFNLDEDELQRLMAAFSSGKEELSADANLRALGYADIEKPYSISIYLRDFAAKEHFLSFIDAYNQDMESSGREDNVISYSDITGVLMSSVKTVVDAISYVLIAFVSISLVVSSIMIGVITLISVQERTKEIGILRAIGASKRNVSSMFNAETVMIGFASGIIGVGLSYLLCIPINAVVQHFTGLPDLKANLPVPVAVILVCISMCLTLFSGIIPSRSAAKKDPVVALRTE